MVCSYISSRSCSAVEWRRVPQRPQGWLPGAGASSLNKRTGMEFPPRARDGTTPFKRRKVALFQGYRRQKTRAKSVVCECRILDSPNVQKVRTPNIFTIFFVQNNPFAHSPLFKDFFSPRAWQKKIHSRFATASPSDQNDAVASFVSSTLPLSPPTAFLPSMKKSAQQYKNNSKEL